MPPLEDSKSIPFHLGAFSACCFFPTKRHFFAPDDIWRPGSGGSWSADARGSNTGRFGSQKTDDKQRKLLTHRDYNGITVWKQVWCIDAYSYWPKMGCDTNGRFYYMDVWKWVINQNGEDTWWYVIWMFWDPHVQKETSLFSLTKIGWLMVNHCIDGDRTCT